MQGVAIKAEIYQSKSLANKEIRRRRVLQSKFNVQKFGGEKSSRTALQNFWCSAACTNCRAVSGWPRNPRRTVNQLL